ncbi:MAG: rhodanese-like domain-containing protein [Planctomycetota bacterium]|nr:rhodanese-like domain-containing protein [Planctomycetota bacterium]
MTAGPPDSNPDPNLPAGARPEYEVSPHFAAARAAEDPAYLILDCRLPSEADAAKIEGSVLVPLHELEDALDDIEDALEERGLPKDAPFAVLCHHGHRSLRAALMLQAAGFPGARSVFGGIELWASAVDTAIPRYVRDGARCEIVR